MEMRGNYEDNFHKNGNIWQTGHLWMIYLLKMVIFGFKTYIDKRMGNYGTQMAKFNGHINDNISEIYGNIYHL